jgi:hypothetical protein
VVGRAHSAQFFDRSTLTHNTGCAEFVLTDSYGLTNCFHDFTVTPTGKRVNNRRLSLRPRHRPAHPAQFNIRILGQ